MTRPTADHYFYDFRLFSITVLGAGQYSTMVDLLHDGAVYALSLDFNARHLEQILAKAPGGFRESLIRELARRGDSPGTVDFQGEIQFGVRARLGRIQKTTTETFVPLVCQEIL